MNHNEGRMSDRLVVNTYVGGGEKRKPRFREVRIGDLGVLIARRKFFDVRLSMG